MALRELIFNDVRALLDLRDITIGDYPALELLIDRIIPAVEDHLGRTLDKGTVTEEWLGPPEPTAMVPLSRLPVASVDEVRLDGETQDADAYTTVAHGLNVTFTVQPDAKVEVDYTGGFDNTASPPEVPGPLRKAITTQVAYEFQSKEAIGAETVETQGGTINRPQLQLLKEVQRLLQPYVHPYKLAINTII